MHFALLLPQLPHLNDNPAQYGDMLSLTRPTLRVRSATIALRAAIMKLFR